MLLHCTHCKYHKVSVPCHKHPVRTHWGGYKARFFYLCCCCEIQAPLPLDRIGLILGMVVALERASWLCSHSTKVPKGR